MSSYLDPIGVVVQQQYSRTCHFLGFHHGLEVCQQTHVFGHICGQNLGGQSLSYNTENRRLNVRVSVCVWGGVDGPYR